LATTTNKGEAGPTKGRCWSLLRVASMAADNKKVEQNFVETSAELSEGINSTRPLSRRIWPPPPKNKVPPKIRRKINSAGRKSAGKKYSTDAEYSSG